MEEDRTASRRGGPRERIEKKKAKRSKLEEPFLCAQKNKRRVVEILGSRHSCIVGGAPLAMPRPRVLLSLSFQRQIGTRSTNYATTYIYVYTVYRCYFLYIVYRPVYKY